MKHSIPALLLAALAAVAFPAFSARAGDAKAAAAKAGTADAGDALSFQAKTKSAFPGAGADHNPFWPIGWEKTEDAGNDASAANSAVPKATDFTVSTILLNDPPMAVINGKEMAEGEVQTLEISGGPVTVQLMAVQDGRVIIRWQNQALTIPLHRDEELSKGDSVAGGQTAAASPALR